MQTVTRSYRLPSPLVDAFDAWRERTGISAQEAVAAGLYHVLSIDGTARDRLLGAMKDALAETASAPPGAAVDIARSRAAAAKDFTDTQRARKSARDKKTG